MSWLVRQRAAAPVLRRSLAKRGYASSSSSEAPPVAEDASAEEQHHHQELGIESLDSSADFAKMREAVKQMSFVRPPQTDGLSAEARDRLNAEFAKFIDDFVYSVDPSQRSAELIAEKVSGVDVSMFGRMASAGSTAESGGNMSGRSTFPALAFTDPSEPYSEAEIYVRQLFHARRVAGLGADIGGDVYKPHEDLHHPRTISETGVDTLLAAGAHLGHATHRVRANCLPYVYGIREGIHIIDLQQTLAALRRVARVVEDLSRKGGLLLFVGTRDGQRRTVERAAQRSHGFYVSDRWVPGTLTNYQTITDQKQKVGRAEIDMGDRLTGRQLSPSLHDTIIKPDLAIILNPVENRAMLAECLKLRIPTAGIVDTDSEPSLLTYAVPGNDDSLRFANLFAGVLSRAAERGRAQRLAEFQQLQDAKQRLKNGEAAVAPANQPPSQPSSAPSETEKQLI